MVTFVAAIPVAIWLYLIFGRGGFWRVSKHLTRDVKVRENKRVVAIIPARDEAAVIGIAVESLLQQNYTGFLHIIVVDDASTDGTAAVVTRTAERLLANGRVTLLSGRPLAPGWTGKLWALSQGVERALRLQPDYLLFTDADIRHGEDNVAELVSIAESRKCDLVSYMVKLHCESAAEKALIPAFVFFFLMLYPPAWIKTRHARTAGAAGGCILIRPDALRKIGGLASIWSAVIDDCALAGTVKRSGGSLWLGLTPATKSIRPYRSTADIGSMIARTAFSQLGHSTGMLTGTMASLFLTYGLSPLLLLTGRPIPMIFGLTAWVLMTTSYWPMVRFYNRSGLWALTLPLVAAFYGGATLYSAIRYWTGKGGFWKGRAQDAKTQSDGTGL